MDSYVLYKVIVWPSPDCHREQNIRFITISWDHAHDQTPWRGAGHMDMVKTD